MGLSEFKEYADPIYIKLRNKVEELKEIYLKVKSAEESIYDEDGNYIEENKEKHHALVGKFNNFVQEIVNDDDLKENRNIERLFGVMPYGLLMSFLQEGIYALQKNSTDAEETRRIIKEKISIELYRNIKKECNEFVVEKLMNTSESYDSKINMQRIRNIKTYGEGVGSLLAEIREEEIEKGFFDIKDVETLINSDERFKEFFIKNTVLVLENIRFSNEFNFSMVYRNLCKDPQLRTEILKALPTIVERTSARQGIIDVILMNLSEEEKIKYSEILFVKSINPIQPYVYYDMIINNLISKIGISNKTMLKMIADNMGNIIEDSKRLPQTLKSLSKVMAKAKQEMSEEQFFEVIDLIDTTLVENIEKIMNKENEEQVKGISGYNSESFDGFQRFQEAIKQRGIDAFNSELYIGEGDIEECKRTAEKYFGKCDTKTLLVMMYGKYGKDRTEIIAGVIEELQKKANIESESGIINIIGQGYSNTAILVGDYVVKIGGYRQTEKLPNDRRILQPIIRQRLPGKEMSGYIRPFIEVQNRVETNWTEDLSIIEIEEELYKIYKEIRERGHIFADISPENIGRLIKENRPNYKFRDTDGEYKDIRPTEIATGLKGEIEEDEVLKPGELVILDSEFIYEEKDFDLKYDSVGWEQTNKRRRRFEKRYKEEKREKEQNSSR